MHFGAAAVEPFAVASVEKSYISRNGDVIEGWVLERNEFAKVVVSIK